MKPAGAHVWTPWNYCWAAACSGPQTHSCSLASLTPLHAATHTSHGREDTGGAVMYPVNVTEVRIWLQILPDLHWPLVERLWEGNNEALAKPRGLLVPLTAITFLMSRDQKSSSPPVLPCSSLQKKAKNPLQSSLQVKKASLPYQMNSPGEGWGRGWRTRGHP